MVNIQEINSGILKRGIIDMVIEGGGGETRLFSLGLFAGGLSSFVSNDEDPPAEKEVEEEAATAGMEISVHGVTIRPFVFFTGQGELMGHVWSGTGSEKTTAYQSVSLLHDHQEFIRLQTGTVAELSLLGAASFDLSGQIQMSLWNRNAQSLVENSAGTSVTGYLKVDNSFVRSQAEFSLTSEPKLLLKSDIDFYGKPALCMQPDQAETIIRHNIFKIERIPGSKHRLRKSTYRLQKIPGRTHVINQKNSDMCNVIFK